MNVLVTGGLGFIGSHTCIELVEAGYNVVIIDNLCNAKEECLRRVEAITGRSIQLCQVDLLNVEALASVFDRYTINHVIHFAALKAVGESVAKPLMYYRNNLIGTLNLLEVMQSHGVSSIVFSSSATVYGEPQFLPITEIHPVGKCANPYGRTKYFVEEILNDICKANPKFNAVLLRYFNPVGAHRSGLIGEDPQSIPNNLMPFISQVAVGKLKELQVFGNDYPTCDGTGVRDYIHVVDLAKGHIAALKSLEGNCGIKVYNLGTGNGYSVLQMVAAMESASGRKISYKIVPRRTGDTATVYADASLAQQELGWTAKFGLKEMCDDTWHWQSLNPQGFETKIDISAHVGKNGTA